MYVSAMDCLLEEEEAPSTPSIGLKHHTCRTALGMSMLGSTWGEARTADFRANTQKAPKAECPLSAKCAHHSRAGCQRACRTQRARCAC